jgi:hypothetical protein
MILKKLLSLWLYLKKNFFLNKKVLAFLIFMSLSVNGFAPSAAEAGKYSFVMVAATSAKNAVMQIFGKYDASLITVASNFYFNIFNFLESAPISQSEDNQENENNTIPPEGVYIEQTVYKEKDKAEASYLPNGIVSNFSQVQTEREMFFRFSGIIILFLVFIAVILRRKEKDAKKFVKNIRILKKKIPA